MTWPRLLLVSLLLAAAPLAACNETTAYADADCDREDVREFDTDCGYWAGDGAFVYWYWVTPGTGGHKPSGFKAKYPAGASRTKPANATGATRRELTPPGVSLKKPTAKVDKPPAKSNSGGSKSNSRSGSTSRSGRR